MNRAGMAENAYEHGHREKKLISIGLAGESGGRLRNLVDHCICIPSDQTPRIQEAHILTGHILCELIEEELFGDK
jgi:D-sedoheptulose 7-phosphate isomerase